MGPSHDWGPPVRDTLQLVCDPETVNVNGEGGTALLMANVYTGKVPIEAPRQLP